MPSLQHLGGDRWRTRTYVTDPVSHRRRLVSRSFTAKGKRTAERIHRQTIGELENENARARDHAASFAGLVDDWLTIKERDASPSTMIAYRRHAKRIKQRFGHLPVDGLTGQMIDAWYTELMGKGMTAANVNHVHRVLRAICRFGHRKRGLPTCPTDQATPPPTIDYEAKPPTPAAIRALLGGVRGEWGRAVSLLAHTGLRRGEVVGLRWEDIDNHALTVRHSIVEQSGKRVHIGPPKGKRQRRVVLTPAARQILDEQRTHTAGRGESPWVFPDWTQDGKLPRRPGWVSLMWGRYITKLIEQGALRSEHRVRLHDLRHAFATTLIDAGVPITTVSAQLGHAKTSTTTDIYGHHSDESDELVVEAMTRALGPGSPAV